jgi:serine/threonine-protein kinase ATR
MAAMQTVLGIEYLAETTLTTWYTFVSTLGFHEIGPYVGSTSAAFVHAWPTFSPASRQVARRTIDYLILENAKDLGPYLDEIVSLDGIVDLVVASERLRNLREQWSTQTILQKILERSTSENVTVATQALGELKQFLLHREEFVQKLASGDAFDPIIGRVVQVLFSAASRDGDASDSLRLMAFDCIGVLSALDPDRFDLAPEDTTMTVINNFTDEGESVSFAVHLIRDLLVGAFRSTSDIKHQSHLAFAIQELLSFCGFTPDLVLSGNANSIPNKVRSRWNSLPKDMLDTVAPLLEGRFQLNARPSVKVQHPIYSTTASYREWIQIWTSHLITRVSGDQARTIFEPFRLAVKSQDVEVARHLLPHLVLNVLISGEDTDRHDIRQEVVIVLEDQSKLDGAQSADKKQLCAQVT